MKKPSFTLTELLVVISIMAILMAIIVPVLRSSRQQTKTVLCNSNIKQLTLGLLIYETENHILPYSFYNEPCTPRPPGGYYVGYEYDRTGWWWFNFTEKYRRSDEKNTVVKCPSKWLTDSKLNNDILCGNYGVNRSICKSSDDRQSHREEFIGKPLRTAEIAKPVQTVLIVDSGYAMISWWHVTDSPPVILGNKIIEDAAYIPGLKINKNRNLWPGQEQDAINGRHPNKTVNIGFADGHTSRIKADDLCVEKTDDSYKNKNPLWVPK
jgi:prepilin-type processing-associated H-X9-DG protein/prepilin-type N-terminal cleavage/methylation domain-containing protein